MKIKITKTYEVNDVERAAIAWSISSKNELASHKECRDYADKAEQYRKMAEGK